MEHAVEDIVDIAYKVYENQDVQLAREIEPLEEVIDELSKELKYRHIQRLRAGECTIEMGFILSDDYQPGACGGSLFQYRCLCDTGS